jgi:large subunit ribosomal protein L23
MDKHMILKPRMSEKAFAQSQGLNTYVFVVPGDATKHTVARAVTAQFEVAVESVNIVNVKGKAKRTVSKGGRRVATGRQNDTKKAYVTLAEGNSLPFFAELTEEAEAPKTDDKKADKKAKKVEKPAKAEKEGKK